MKLQLKVVPGASKNQVAGFLGDRLKVRVVAPPESGKANKAVIALLATFFDQPKAHIAILSGTKMAFKTVEIQGLSEQHFQQCVARLLSD